MWVFLWDGEDVGQALTRLLAPLFPRGQQLTRHVVVCPTLAGIGEPGELNLGPALTLPDSRGGVAVV